MYHNIVFRKTHNTHVYYICHNHGDRVRKKKNQYDDLIAKKDVAQYKYIILARNKNPHQIKKFF